jgi:hypothetical protein
VRRAQAIKTVAWGLLVAGVAAPLLRKRLPVRPVVAQTVAFGAPLGAAVAMRPSRTRDAVVCALQMWAYLAAYKAPHDDPTHQQSRVQIDYPIAIDRLLGLGELPTVRLQRAFAKEDWRAGDRVLVWAHWLWFAVPHGSLLYILLRHPHRFGRAAVMTYAVFDLGAIFYWIVPTAPPWYAASVAGRSEEFDHELLERTGEARPAGHVPVDWPAASAHARENGHREQIVVRRMMVEYGEFFWKDGWGPLYSVLGGNPLAAMPSLHFATSMMAAQLLAETGPLAGALGWSYVATLGVALVYLGEHYVVDLLAGAALTKTIRRLGPRAGPAISGVGSAVASIEAHARGTG